MATARSRRVSRASYTSPMPPAPSGPTISYGPEAGAWDQWHSYLRSRDYILVSLDAAPPLASQSA